MDIVIGFQSDSLHFQNKASSVSRVLSLYQEFKVKVITQNQHYKHKILT